MIFRRNLNLFNNFIKNKIIYFFYLFLLNFSEVLKICMDMKYNLLNKMSN
jgi:hypothetical protein